MDVAIIDTGIGNFGSVANMTRRVGGSPRVTSSIAEIATADRIVLPGVGSFDVAARRLRELQLTPVIRERVQTGNVPVLGICLGMQLFGDGSEEGEEPGLAWIPGKIVRFSMDSAVEEVRVPHIGWSAITVTRNNPLLDGLNDGAEFYFVHSYHFDTAQDESVVATANYGSNFPAVIAHNSMYGVQFHPEKSQDAGERLFSNFVNNLGNH